MATFDDRERGFEAKFAHDATMQFKAEARRNKLLGLWAAAKMGHADPEAYAKEVIASDFEEAGDEDVYRKVWGDLQAKGVDISEHRVRKQMSELLDTARRQAEDAGFGELRELQELVLHGTLHLLGYDHSSDQGEMNRLELDLRRELLP